MNQLFRYLFPVFLFLSSSACAQGIHQLWGVTTNYGFLGKGTIFRTNYNGQALSVEHAFDDARPGTNGCDELTEYNGEMFATVFQGGTGSNSHTLMKWNPVTNVYTALHYFDYAAFIPTGRIYVFNGKIYGLTMDGGKGNAGVIY